MAPSKPSFVDKPARHPSLLSISFDETRGAFMDSAVVDSRAHRSPTSITPRDTPVLDPVVTSPEGGNRDTKPSSKAGIETADVVKPKKSHAKQKPLDHIPRPKNAFIQYRSDMVREGKIRVPDGDSRKISRIAGQRWRELDLEQKSPWAMRAKIERDEFNRKYPDYQYGPKKKISTKGSTPRSSAPRKGRKATRPPTRKPYSRPVRLSENRRFVDEDYDELDQDSDLEFPLRAIDPDCEMAVDESVADISEDEIPSRMAPPSADTSAAHSSSLSTDAVPIPRVFSHIGSAVRSRRITVDRAYGRRTTNNSLAVSIDTVTPSETRSLAPKQVHSRLPSTSPPPLPPRPLPPATSSDLSNLERTSSDISVLHPEYEGPFDEAFEVDNFAPGADYTEFAHDASSFLSEGLLGLFNSSGAAFYIPGAPDDLATAQGSPVTMSSDWSPPVPASDWVNELLDSTVERAVPYSAHPTSLFSPTGSLMALCREDDSGVPLDVSGDLWSYHRGLERLSDADA